MADAVKTDAQVESSTTNEVVNEVVETTTQPQEATTTTNDIPIPQGDVEAVDGRGVPWKNVAMEKERKFNELVDKLPTLMEEAISQGFQKHSPNKEREYTVAELEQYAIENPQYRPWVEEQKEQIRMKKLTAEFDKKIQAVDKVKADEAKKQQSLQYVMQTYPDAFVKSTDGKIVNWNSQHPLAQSIFQIMKDQRLANDPEGLAIASDIAYARYIKTVTPKVQKETQALKNEVKDLQKGTLIEAGNNKADGASDYTNAMDKLKKTGSMKDAVEALRAISKARSSKNEE